MNTQQKNHSQRRIFMLFCLLAFMTNSCIDQRYDISKGISMKMAIGGDSLSIPLASTDSIKLSKIINADSIEMILMDSSGYKISMSDSVSVEMPSIDKTQLTFDNISFNLDTAIRFMDAADVNFNIPAISKKISVNMGDDNISIESFSIPGITLNKFYASDVSDFKLSEEDKKIQINTISTSQGNLLSSGSLEYSTDQHISVPLQLPDPTLEVSSANEFGFNISTPEKIAYIYDILLQTAPLPATFEIKISLDGAAHFTAGAITPNLSIKPGDIFVFEEDPDVVDGKILFTEGDILSSENSFSKSKIFNINSLNINKASENGLLNILDSIKMTGSVFINNLMCYADEIDEVLSSGFKVEIIINDMLIESMNFEISDDGTIEADIKGNTSFNFSSELDEKIADVDSIILEQPATISFKMTAPQGMSGLNGNILIKNYQLFFPEEFIMFPMTGLDISTNTYTIENEFFDVKNGKEIIFNIKGFNLVNHFAENKVISWDGDISYSGKYSISGKMNSNDLTTTECGIQMKVSSNMKIDYAHILTNDINVDIPQVSSPINFNINASDQMDSIGSANIQDGSFLTLTFTIPDMPLPMTGNIDIQFPKLIKFKNAPTGLDENNIYHIDGNIPSSIQLEIGSLNINKKTDNGYLSILDSVTVSGNILMESGHAASNVLIDKINEKILVDIAMDKMIITGVDITLTGVNAEFYEDLPFVQTIDIPDMIKKIDSLTFSDNTTLSIALDVQNAPDIDLMLDFRVILPDKFILQGENLSGNLWRFTDTLQNGQSIAKQIHLAGLDISGETIGSSYTFDDKIVSNIKIYSNDPTINSESINSDPVLITASVNLTNASMEGVYGIIDPQLESISQSIALDGIPDMLRDTGLVLDVSPIISMNAKTNIGIPININGSLIPVIDGKKMTDREQKLSLSIEKAATPQDFINNKFWLAEDNSGMPDDYTFVKLNLGEIFTSIPDSIVFEMNAETDQSIQHEYLVDGNYQFDLDYDVNLPLKFGQNFKLSIKDTINLEMNLGMDSMPIEFGDYVELLGTITNSIPLDMDITLTPIDKDGDIITLTKAIKDKVASGNSDGSATVSPLSIKIENEKKLLNDLGGFIIEFSVTSNSTVAGTPLRPENFIKADLGVRVVGGIIIDLDEE